MGRFPKLGTLFNREFRDSYNQGVDKVDAELELQKKRVDDLIIKAPQPSEIVDARGEFPVLRDRMENIDTKSDVAVEKSTDAQAKATNPLGAMLSAGQKVTMDLLANDVKEAMVGNTGITTAKGYLENNRGVIFPLMNVTRDGVLYTVSETVKNVLLDAKVINAKKGKIYAVTYIANGLSGSYGVSIYEYDKSTFGTDSAASRRMLVYYNRDWAKTVKTGITNIVIEDEVKEGVTFHLTIDFSQITGDNLNISNTTNGQAYGAIIDESLYTYRPDNFLELQAGNSLPLVCYRPNGYDINIKFSYNNSQNMILKFAELGINKIIHLKEIHLQNRTSAAIGADFESNKTLLYNATSDWISPYRIRAVNNGNSNGYLTTGGNHGTESGSGFPTATKDASVGVYADNKEVRTGDLVYVNEKVVIQTTNYVSAMNTIDLTTGVKRDVLKEMVTYTITPKNISVTVEFEALEDITMRDYSGLQAQEGPWAGTLYYMADAGNPVKFDISGTGTGQSSVKSVATPDRWVMKKGSDVAVAYYDTSVGLGQRVNVGSAENLFWHTESKVYGKLIYDGGSYIPLNKGQSMYWSGGYVFTTGLACPGAETAYFYHLSGKKVYVVDFFSAANTYLTVERSDFNKKITVLEKSNSITVDNFISSKGLKITASGYGQIKFTVD